MNVLRHIALMILFVLPAYGQQSIDTTAVRSEILMVMNMQVLGWNSGSLESFMNGYTVFDSLRFASGGSVTYGWKTMLERYKKSYSSPEKMGTLEFSRISVDILSADAAIAFGEWKLLRESDTPHGLFTLLFRRTPGGWKIVHDHTSSASEK